MPVQCEDGATGGDAFFQRGGFFAAAPWHIFQATPSMFRAQCWAGGGAYIQRGAFFAAAPWRIFQATPQAQQKVVPVSGASIGGGEEMARKEIPAVKTYKLPWGCPRWAGREEQAGDSPKCAFSVSSRRRKKRKAVPPAEKTAR
jgi:hypothetical protein